MNATRPGDGHGAAPLPAVCFTGRFQPLHCDHLDMALHGLALARRLIVGITNPDPARRVAHAASAHRHLAESNPLSFAQRSRLVEAALHAAGVAAGRFDIVAFPLDEPSAWARLLPAGTPQLVRVFSDWEREKARRFAAAGYPPIVLEGDPARRATATEIRRLIRCGEAWQDQVPAGARELLEEWLRDAAWRTTFSMPGALDGHA